MGQSERVQIGKGNRIAAKVEIGNIQDEVKAIKLRMSTLYKDCKNGKANDVFEGKDEKEAYEGSNENMV